VANCTGCEQSFQTHIFVAIFSLLLTITTVYLMRYTHIRNDPDILGMYSELYSSSMVMLGLSIIFLLLTVLDPGNLYADGLISWSYIICVGALLSFSIVVPLQIYKSYLIPKNLSDHIELDQTTILHSKIGINYLKMHLFAVHDLDNIRSVLFWQNAVSWRKAYNTTSVIVREENFTRIFETFIERKGMMHISISVDAYEQMIDDSDRTKNIPKHIFELSIKQTEEALSSTYGRFTGSEHYKLLLRGLQGKNSFRSLGEYTKDLTIAA